MRSAGLFATQAAATAKGNPELAAKSKVGQMFGSGSPLRPFVEPLTMYYQVIIFPAPFNVHHSWFPCHDIVVTLLLLGLQLLACGSAPALLQQADVVVQRKLAAPLDDAHCTVEKCQLHKPGACLFCTPWSCSRSCCDLSQDLYDSCASSLRSGDRPVMLFL